MSSNNSQRAKLPKNMNRSLFFFALAALASVVFQTNAEDWKLQPLKYNNPGLVVDLGVGLWAWPLPMD
ncbi:MAG: hypothetical protein CMO61_09475, partial [Verrucomicrobiales bacterium]|nr:hypothetical protein [Verrucomicrobiales bacterium]